MSQDPTRLEGYDQRLVDYVYGELSDARVAEVERRLERDPDARAEVDSLRAVRSAFSAIPDAEPSPKVTYDILREARVAAADRAAAPKPWFGLALPPLLTHPGFASVCVLILASGAILALQKTGADRPSAPVAAEEELGVFAAKAESRADVPVDALADAPADVQPESPPTAAPAVRAEAPSVKEAEAPPRRARKLTPRAKTPAKPNAKAAPTRRAKIAKPDLALSRGAPGGKKGWGGGGQAPSSDKDADGALEGGFAASQAPAPDSGAAVRADDNAPMEVQASAGMDMDDLIAAELPQAYPLGSAGNVATPRSSAPATSGRSYGYEVGDDARTSAAGGVRGGVRHQDLAARELKLQFGDLDRLPAGRAWGDSLGAVARSGQRSSGVDRVRRKLLAMNFGKRALYARFIREQVNTLQAQGHTQAAEELRTLLEQIELDESKELSVEEDEAAGMSDDGDAEKAAEVDAVRDDKTAPKVEQYRQGSSKRKAKKAKVRMVKKSRSAPVPMDGADADQAEPAQEPAAPTSPAF